MFPTLIGVSLSHHVTSELSQGVHEAILAHKELSSTRVKAVIGSLSTRLMSDTSLKGKKLKHALDAAFTETEGVNAGHHPNRRSANRFRSKKSFRKRPTGRR
jgi:hypothetical protein